MSMIRWTRFTLCFCLVAGLATAGGPAHADVCAAVERELVRGSVALEDAKDKAGFLRSAREFEAAIRKAPRCAQAQFNLGIVYEKAGEYGNAVSAFRRYLKLQPKANDADSVQRKIYALEYRIERAAARARTGANRTSPSDLGKLVLVGVWCQISTKTDRPDCSRDRLFIERSGNDLHFTWRYLGREMIGRIVGSGLIGKDYPYRRFCPKFYGPAEGWISSDKNRISIKWPAYFSGQGWPPPCHQLQVLAHRNTTHFAKQR